MDKKRNLLMLDADAFLRAPIIDTSVALEIYGISDGTRAAVTDKLKKLCGDVCLFADGKATALSALGAAETVELPAQADFSKKRYTAADAVRVIERLARDGDGCPWDRVQTHESIRINMIEEAYEAVDAIDKRDLDNMCEEFGDVFLQSILQSDIARRSGEFDFSDVCDGLCKKLIGRHTFIFGSDTACDPDEAIVGWEKAKAVEKHYGGVADQLKKLPDNFPALLLCEKTYKKLKKAGAAKDPRAELEKAIAAGDNAGIIAAAVALLYDEGKNAEVEVNKLVKQRIAEL